MNDSELLEKVMHSQVSLHLSANDVLYFLHIPKTAGTSLIRILDDLFDYNVILQEHGWDELLPTLSKDFTKFRLIRGHFGYGMHRLLPQKPIYITMLRDPIQTVISSLKMVMRQPELSTRYSFPTSDISETIEKEEGKIIQNPQTRHIGLDLDTVEISTETLKKNPNHHLGLGSFHEFINPSISDDLLLNYAKDHLLQFPFVGLVEKMEESLMLLWYTFCWKPTKLIPRLNIAPKTQTETLTEKAEKIILKKVKLDESLYEFGKKIFNIRYTKMIKELKQRYLTKENSILPEKELIYKLLEKHYEFYYKKNENYSYSINYDFSKPLVGNGWHYREIHKKTNKIFRWSGPEKISTLHFPISKNRNLKIQFHVLMFNKNYLIDNFNPLCLEINGNNVVLHHFDDDSGIIFEGDILSDFLTDSDYARFKFRFDKTFEVNHRKIGFAMDWFARFKFRFDKTFEVNHRKIGFAMDWLRIY